MVYFTVKCVNFATSTLFYSLVSQCYATNNELSHVHVDVNQQSSNSLTNCSTNSCDSGTVLLNVHVYCKFMTKVTLSVMLFLGIIHDSLLPCVCICLVTSVCVCTYNYSSKKKTACLLFATQKSPAECFSC